MNLMTDKKPRFTLVGQVFGKLVVQSVAGYTRPACGKAEWYYACQCECGGSKIVPAQSLRKGEAKSCGCLVVGRKTHGMSFTRTYTSWNSMHQRCSNTKHKSYADYGGRGISVCDQWATFEGFYADMGDRPAKTTLERKNSNGNYEPSNCIWASPDVQNNNRRNSLRVIYKGESMGFLQAATLSGIKRSSAKWELRKGVPLEEIINGAVWAHQEVINHEFDPTHHHQRSPAPVAATV